MREQTDHSSKRAGRRVFASGGVWVLDGGVLAYSERESEIGSGCNIGDFVRGDFRFGVDPFFYPEQHYKLPGIPALIHDWQINSIEQDTTPFLLSDDGRRYIGDQNQRSHRSDEAPEFVLYCSKRRTEPSHKF